jgi:hypothetical protein
MIPVTGAAGHGGRCPLLASLGHGVVATTWMSRPQSGACHWNRPAFADYEDASAPGEALAGIDDMADGAASAVTRRHANAIAMATDIRDISFTGIVNTCEVAILFLTCSRCLRPSSDVAYTQGTPVMGRSDG